MLDSGLMPLFNWHCGDLLVGGILVTQKMLFIYLKCILDGLSNVKTCK
jgi:hypothetical protein